MSNWMGVVHAAHVQEAVELGIAQLNHGRRAPLERMRPGDTLIYYSPRQDFGDKAPLRSFTAVGTVPDGGIWQAGGGGFQPYRRRVDYLPGHPVPLEELRGALHFTAEPNWGYQLRRGLVVLDDHDASLIRAAMTS